MRSSIIILSAAIIAVFSANSSVAAMDKTDLMVGMKTLPLLKNKITGTIKIAVVFDPNRPGSLQEAEAVKSMIDAGLELPADLNATGVIVPTDKVEKMSGSKIAIVTSDLDAYYGQISDFADAQGILTITTDLNCVRQNKCILGIVSKPRVEIYYSKIGAENAKIDFEQAFTMLVKKAPD